MRDALFSRSNTCSRAAGGGSGGRHVYLFAEYTVDNKRDGTRPGEFIAEGGEIGTKKKKKWAHGSNMAVDVNYTELALHSTNRHSRDR